MCGDGVRVDDRGTTTSDHGPYAAFGVEHGEFKRSTGRAVQLLDVGFFLGQITTEGSWPNLETTNVNSNILSAREISGTYHGWAAIRGNLSLGSGCGSGFVHRQITGNCPLGPTDGLGSLVEFSSHVKVMDGRLAAIDSIETDQRVDFQVRKVEVHIDRVQTDEEVHESFFLLGRDVGEEGRGDFSARWEWRVDGNVEFVGLGIHVTNVYPTFVSEEDGVTLASRVDADVVFGMGRVGEEGLDNEVVECPRDGLNLGKKEQVSMLLESRGAMWTRPKISLPLNACCLPTNTFD
jgi:hypothetical protein